MKISKAKRNNQKRTKLAGQGKLKTRRHRPKKQIKQKIPVKKVVEEDEEVHDAEDLTQMIEDDDIEFMKNAVQNKSYHILKNVYKESNFPVNKKKRKVDNENENIEDKYEKNVFKGSNDEVPKKMKLLLPVKTKEGLIKKMFIENKDNESETTPNENVIENDVKDDPDSDDDILATFKLETDEPMTTAKLLACREDALNKYKLKIGILSSEVLEKPELKIKNFQQLLNFIDEKTPGICITVRKWAICSLSQIFEDLLPSYNIVQIKQDGIKLKKDTLQLQNYEAALLNYYKQYLKKLEKISSILRRKGFQKHSNNQEYELAKISIKSMSELLNSHQYFNFSTNIANFLIPFLNNKNSDVREIVFNCIKRIFKEDKRGELTLIIVRRLNQFVKLHGHSVHSEIILVLLDLKIKDVNLDKEKEEDTQQKKLMSHKSRILALSKRERKRSKKLQEVEKELLETKAEENKQAKQKIYTEITSLVFTIYFRILKEAPNSKILTACLEGLAKFAACINIEFYQDLVNVLNGLLDKGQLGIKEQLYCVQTVFVMLSGQAASLNIDPIRFYTHCYKIMLNINIAKVNVDIDVLIKTLIIALVNRYKNLNQNRLLAFVKRMLLVALNLENNGSFGLLGIIRKLMLTGKAIGILLDTDSGKGSGLYLPELEDPEYCNAQSSAAWELIALRRHYNDTVKSLAKNLAYEVPTSGEGSLPIQISKLSPEEISKINGPEEDVFKDLKISKIKNNKNKLNKNVKHFSIEFDGIHSDDLFIRNCDKLNFYKEIQNIKS